MESEHSVLTKQKRIAENAKRLSEVSFTSLSYHMDLGWMREAYRRTRKDGANGVDAQTAEQYAQDLDANLTSLLERAKAGSYVAPPVKRVYIPKGGSRDELRPIGVPTFEEKVLQRAVVMLLEPLYEQDFLDCSYGFRPGRSAHQALEALWRHLMDMRGGWVIDLDIRKFFDSASHSHLREILRKRVRDGVITRLIGKWLKAGVWEEGSVSHPEEGVPQGGVISPLLSNVLLHEVLDIWFDQVVKKHLYGQGALVRYADDAVMVFSDERDARRVMEVLPKRFARYGLTVHPEKTRVVRFGRPPLRPQPKQEWEPFDSLGFTHYWARSRKGSWIVKRKTAKSRFTRAVKAVTQWCRVNRHEPLAFQRDSIARKLQGHYAYYGITGNSDALRRFLEAVKRNWYRALARRGSPYDWKRFHRLLAHYVLPPIRVVHSIYRREAVT
jgi:RNA-directed DNA polymerase